MTNAWVIFLIAAAVIVVAGTRLSRDADTLAEHTGLGGAWIGAVLVAGVTSLPELATGISAVQIGSANLTLGNLFGAIMTNMLVLGLADLTRPNLQVLGRVGVNQAIVGVLAMGLTAGALAGALAHAGLTVMGVGWGSVAALAGYFLGMRLLHVNRNEEAFRSAGEVQADLAVKPPLWPAVIGFVISASVIVLTSRFLASSADALATQMGLTRGFAGMILLALVTTLPEIVVTLAAVRTGAYDMAVGNLLGSNCFNMALLLPLDIADGPGPLLARMETGMQVAALFGILLMGQVVLGVLHRPQRHVWFLEPHALFLVLTYGFGIFLVYRMGSG